MGLKVSRKGVYLATIVAMVGLSAGFALATFTLGSGYSDVYGTIGTGSNVNNFGSTAYTPSGPATGGTNTVGTCATTADVSAGSIFVAANGVTCAAGDVAVEVPYTVSTFTCPEVGGTYTGSDLFTLTGSYTSGGTQSIGPASASITCTTGDGVSSASFDLWIDLGASATTASGITVTITATAGDGY